MNRSSIAVVLALLTLGAGGCSAFKPYDYAGQHRSESAEERIARQEREGRQARERIVRCETMGQAARREVPDCA